MNSDDDLKTAFFVVQATSFELFSLWREWHEHIPMEQDGRCFVYGIGQINKRPVCVEVSRYKIWDKWVLFYSSTSQLVDWEMIENWVEEKILTYTPKWDNSTRCSHTNAMNFHHCVHALEEATGNKHIPFKD
jgi:hypothetical protein